MKLTERLILSGFAILLGVWLWFPSLSMADEVIHQMLPLAVENSWEYEHETVDTNTNIRFRQRVTISITHTEDIEGHTYFVFTDMPYEEPPVPYFFIAGKTARWEGDHLLFRQQDRDVVLYQFDGHLRDERGAYNYAIPETESDTLVFVEAYAGLVGKPRKEGCVVNANTISFLYRT